MKFLQKCRLNPSDKYIINLPDQTDLRYYPSSLSIKQVDEAEESAQDIHLSVLSDNSDLHTFTEAYFAHTSEITLDSYSDKIISAKRMSVRLINRSHEPKMFHVYSEYRKHEGVIIHEAKIDHFENILNDIHRKGVCSQLFLKFNRPVSRLQLEPIAECLDDDNWIGTIDISGEENEQTTFTLEFTGELEIYSHKLCYLLMNVKDTNQENDEPLTLYAVAYGYRSKGT